MGRCNACRAGRFPGCDAGGAAQGLKPMRRASVRLFKTDLMAHIPLENNILFDNAAV